MKIILAVIVSIALNSLSTISYSNIESGQSLDESNDIGSRSMRALDDSYIWLDWSNLNWGKIYPFIYQASDPVWSPEKFIYLTKGSNPQALTNLVRKSDPYGLIKNYSTDEPFLLILSSLREYFKSQNNLDSFEKQLKEKTDKLIVQYNLSNDLPAVKKHYREMDLHKEFKSLYNRFFRDELNDIKLASSCSSLINLINQKEEGDFYLSDFCHGRNQITFGEFFNAAELSGLPEHRTALHLFRVATGFYRDISIKAEFNLEEGIQQVFSMYWAVADKDWKVSVSKSFLLIFNYSFLPETIPPKRVRKTLTSSRNVNSLQERPTLNQLLNLEIGDQKHRFIKSLRVDYELKGTFLLNDHDGSVMAQLQKEKKRDSSAIAHEIIMKWLMGEGTEVSWNSLLRAIHNSNNLRNYSDIKEALTLPALSGEASF